MSSVSQDFKTIALNNIYSQDEIDKAFVLIANSGIKCDNSSQILNFKFDVVDLKFLEKNAQNNIVLALTKELQKIKSYSTNNGKMVYASFNKAKKVANKKQNAKKRLAYESYKKDFSSENFTLSKDKLNQIICGDSLEVLQKMPNNCVDIVLTSPPYNFGINYNATDDANAWKGYFATFVVVPAPLNGSSTMSFL